VLREALAVMNNLKCARESPRGRKSPQRQLQLLLRLLRHNLIAGRARTLLYRNTDPLLNLHLRQSLAKPPLLDPHPPTTLLMIYFRVYQWHL
jgi:hypothetical protein